MNTITIKDATGNIICSVESSPITTSPIDDGIKDLSKCSTECTKAVESLNALVTTYKVCSTEGFGDTAKAVGGKIADAIKRFIEAAKTILGRFISWIQQVPSKIVAMMRSIKAKFGKNKNAQKAVYLLGQANLKTTSKESYSPITSVEMDGEMSGSNTEKINAINSVAGMGKNISNITDLWESIPTNVKLVLSIDPSLINETFAKAFKYMIGDMQKLAESAQKILNSLKSSVDGFDPDGASQVYSNTSLDRSIDSGIMNDLRLYLKEMCDDDPKTAAIMKYITLGTVDTNERMWDENSEAIVEGYKADAISSLTEELAKTTSSQVAKLNESIGHTITTCQILIKGFQNNSLDVSKYADKINKIARESSYIFSASTGMMSYCSKRANAVLTMDKCIDKWANGKQSSESNEQ